MNQNLSKKGHMEIHMPITIFEFGNFGNVAKARKQNGYRRLIVKKPNNIKENKNSVTRMEMHPIQARYQAALHPELKAQGLQTDYIISQVGEKSSVFGKIGPETGKFCVLMRFIRFVDGFKHTIKNGMVFTPVFVWQLFASKT